MPAISNPRQVILVTSRAVTDIFGKETTKDDAITVTWHMPCSHDPELYAVCIGKKRFSYSLIMKSGVFAVNFIPQSFEEKALFCGTHSGEHIDKFRQAGIAKEECDNIDCSRITDAVAYIECEVVNEIEAGDHVIFIGKVLSSATKNDKKRLFQAIGSRFTTTL